MTGDSGHDEIARQNIHNLQGQVDRLSADWQRQRSDDRQDMRDRLESVHKRIDGVESKQTKLFWTVATTLGASVSALATIAKGWLK